MSESLDRIKETLALMGDDELLERVNAGMLTDDAYSIAHAELTKRGVTPPPMRPTQPILGSKQTYSSLPEVEPRRGLVLGFVLDCYRGKKRLWMAYWVLGLLGGFIIGIFSLTKMPLLYLPVYLLIYIFWSISVWRCSFRTSSVVWMVAARVAVVVNFVLPFLLLPSLLSR